MSNATRKDDSLVRGTCRAPFEQVREEFARNLSERGERGASVCVIHEGRTVVDLWGGTSDADGRRRWARDTVVVAFSCTKGATALCAHLLASAGELDIDSPVSRYWPSFSREGKGTITVRMLLNHQAGLPGLSRPVEDQDIYDFDQMTRLIEAERPLWEPGTRHGYHTLTFGWLVGEVVRRVSGVGPGDFFRSEIAEPLDLDFFIGLPASEESRVATTLMGPGDLEARSSAFHAALKRGKPIQVAVANSVGNYLSPGGCDAPGAHAAVIPAANGVTNARGLAGLYAPLSLDGAAGGVRLVPESQIAHMLATESAGCVDAVGLEPTCYSAGFEKAAPGLTTSQGQRANAIPESAFGHTGLGGAVAFADPGARLAFGYAMNRHANVGEAATARSQPLVAAVYRALAE